jgi:hypothetical protein
MQIHEFFVVQVNLLESCGKCWGNACDNDGKNCVCVSLFLTLAQLELEAGSAAVAAQLPVGSMASSIIFHLQNALYRTGRWVSKSKDGNDDGQTASANGRMEAIVKQKRDTDTRFVDSLPHTQ